MGIKFTDEALVLWNQLSEEDKLTWTTNGSCQNCRTPIDSQNFSGSIYEEQLALFHLCPQCGTKEVRLIDTSQEQQQEIDDDFERWLQSKRKAHPETFEK